MNNYTNESNTLTNNAEANIMNKSTNELIALPKKPVVNMMNLFDDVAISEEIKNPQDLTLEDCKKMLHPIFKQTSNDNEISVSVRLQGLTMLKINKNKTTMIIPRDSFTKDELLERIKSCDEMILEAKDRLLASLKKAQISRETTYKRKSKGKKPEFFDIEQHGKEYSEPCCSE